MEKYVFSRTLYIVMVHVSLDNILHYVEFFEHAVGFYNWCVLVPTKYDKKFGWCLLGFPLTLGYYCRFSILNQSEVFRGGGCLLFFQQW